MWTNVCQNANNIFMSPNIVSRYRTAHQVVAIRVKSISRSHSSSTSNPDMPSAISEACFGLDDGNSFFGNPQNNRLQCDWPKLPLKISRCSTLTYFYNVFKGRWNEAPSNSQIGSSHIIRTPRTERGWLRLRRAACQLVPAIHVVAVRW